MNRTLLTIVTESSLEKTLVKDIEKIGAKGYTISDARGKGHRGIRDGDWDANSNIRIEVISEDTIAMEIMSYLQEHYYKDFAMIVYSHEVSVLRPEKF